MSRKVLQALPVAGPTRSSSKRSSVGSVGANTSAAAGCAPIDPQQERALVDACTCGDAAAVSSALARIQDHQGAGQQGSLSRDFEELVGYAFACAAGGSHVHVLELLLLSSGSIVRQSLMHGVCRDTRRFAPRAFFHCCLSLRYVAFAAVVSIERRAVSSLEWLTARHPLGEEEAEGEGEIRLLMDADAMRCFRLAFTLASASFAAAPSSASTAQPEQFRPLLMLLLSRNPTLLLPLVHSAQAIDALLFAGSLGERALEDGAVAAAAQALRSSLLYEFMTNTTT